MFLLDSIPNASDQPVSSPTVSDRTDPIRVFLPQLISYVFDLTIWVRRSTRLYSLYLSTRRSSKISSYEERNQRLWINSGLFTNLNVTCVMQVMLVLHAAICICTTYWLAFSRQAFFGPKESYEEFLYLKRCTNKFDRLVYEMWFYSRTETCFQCAVGLNSYKVFN